MNVDFGKPFNGILARLNIVASMTVWAGGLGYLIYLGFVHDRSPIMWVGVVLTFVLWGIVGFFSIRKLWLHPKFRITQDVFQVRDVGPVWKLKRYKLTSISDERGYGLP